MRSGSATSPVIPWTITELEEAGERARVERAIQGLPPVVEDQATLDAVAQSIARSRQRRVTRAS